MIPLIRPGEERFFTLLRQKSFQLDKVEATVKEIVEAVKTGGDEQLCAITARLDGIAIQAADLPVSKTEIEAAYQRVSDGFLSSLRLASGNIARFHRRQLRNSWFDPQPDGTVLGQMITPLARVGIYVPGGKASYPSSVLMNAIPAAVAGVREIVMVTPPRRDGSISPYTLVAAAEAGVTEIYRVGGAQAIAALAYGTATIKKVDLITGPGNIYVTAAKRRVFGTVAIDMLAGPSEVLLVADENARPDFIAADMLAQAEHDEMASAVLVTVSRRLAEEVRRELAEQLEKLHRREVAARSLAANGAIILTDSIEEAIDIANSLAPEHLELMVDDPYLWLGRITCAGAVFLGHYTPEAVGDYIAGPNHILPTNGTARFFSPLNVDTFLKKTSVLGYSRTALEREGMHAVVLAEMEGLDAHAASVRVRLAGHRPPQGENNHQHPAAAARSGNVGRSAAGLQAPAPSTDINNNTLRNLPGMRTLKPAFGDLHRDAVPEKKAGPDREQIRGAADRATERKMGSDEG